MITPLLQTALEPVIDRHRHLRCIRWFVLALVMLTIAAAIVVTRQVEIPGGKLIVAPFIILLFLIARFAAQLWQPDFRGIARRIEEQHPELHALLITAVEQQPDPQTGRLNFLQQRVVRQVAEESRRANWLDAVPGWHLASLYLMAAALTFAAFTIVYRTTPLTAPPLVADAPAELPVTVNPGDTTVERGSGLVVLADFHRHPPGEATLIVQSKNQPAQRIPLVKNLDDPVFGGGLPEIDADLTYHVEYAGQATREFSVRVFEHPRLDRADATLHYPDYTKLPEKKVPDTHRVSGVEGTKLDVAFQLNKPVKSATLVAKDGTKVSLAVQADKPLAELRDFPLKASQTYELKLEDADGRANKMPAQFIVEALPNRRPELKFINPKGDPRVSPIEEVAFRADVWDDFGLSRYGLTINVAGKGEKQIELGRDTRADEKKEAAYLLKLEELGVKADELVTWFLWADDVGPDGKVRHSATDMYFAEVRPFEEIFRRDNSGGKGGDESGQGESQSTKLAELQKQIVSATWNLKRAEDGAERPSDKYLKDEPVVRDSQSDALEQATQMVTKLEDPKLHALAENAVHEMQTALDHLTKAATTTAPLSDALTAEQTAYDALLKLAAHEFRVRRSKSQGKNTAQQRQQQQLDQLEMKDEKERYETNREAKPEEKKQQREQLAILNRLKELAQRQQDINERLKELQTALQDAKTEQQKDEIRRQLKRLQEEEKQMLSDIDETKQKMEQSAQQAQLANERQQLEKTRSEAQQTAESMEKGAASKALASGTRAQRDLQEMRDEFRKKTSGQFSEDMRQMRSDARELAQNQEELAEKLQPQPAKQERPTLDGSGEREQLAQKFTKQQGDLNKLTEKMKDVSDQAETAEPLLAKELYDTLRKTTQAGTDKTLEMSQQLAQRGNADDARRFEQKARKEIDELKTGVERAAESVLGNEADALRAARAEVDALKNDLEREIARARPDLAQNSPTGKDGEKSDKAGQQGRPGEKPENGEKGAAQPDGKQPSGKEGKEASQQSENGEKKGGGGQKGNGQQKGDGEQKSEDPSGNQTAEASGKGEGKGKPGETAKAGGEKGGVGQQAQGAPSPGESGGGESPTAQQGGKGGNAGSAAQRNANAGGQRDRGQLRQLASHAGENAGFGGGGNGGGGADTAYDGPLTGERFVEWSDRLRNVEEMVDDPNLRAEIARIRETAKGVRVDFKRNGAEPKWDIVKAKIGAPLAELHDRLTEELARRESKESLVPLDRDPVPPKYVERVRRYYEELGRSR